MDPLKGVFRGFDIASSGLRAELARSEVVASNIANMHVNGTDTREPYRRKSLIFEEALERATGALGGAVGRAEATAGVEVAAVVEDRRTPFKPRFDPGHPDADANGFVLMPNVDMFKELVDMTVIERSFQANMAALRTYRQMVQVVVDRIGR